MRVDSVIADDLSQVTEDLFTLQSDVDVPMRESLLVLESAGSNASIQNDISKDVRAVKHLLARIQAIGEDVGVMKTDFSLLKTDLVVIRAEQGSRFAPSGDSPEDAADDLMDYITAGERGDISRHGISGALTGAVVSPSKSSRSDDEIQDVGEVRSILAKLFRPRKRARQSSLRILE